MEDFAQWLNQELDKRGWSRSEAARRGGISDSMFGKVIGGYAQPGLDFCRGVAKAFGVPLEDVLRRAGILPNRRQLNGAEELLHYYEAMPDEDRQRVLAIARALYQATVDYEAARRDQRPVSPEERARFLDSLSAEDLAALAEEIRSRRKRKT